MRARSVLLAVTTVLLLGPALVLTTARLIEPDGTLWVQAVAFTPVALVPYALLLPVLRAYSLLAAAHAFLAGAGMFALCRARGRSQLASLLAAVAISLGGFVVLQVRHLMFVEATAWIPLVTLAALRVCETRSPRSIEQQGAAGYHRQGEQHRRRRVPESAPHGVFDSR